MCLYACVFELALLTFRGPFSETVSVNEDTFKGFLWRVQAPTSSLPHRETPPSRGQPGEGSDDTDVLPHEDILERGNSEVCLRFKRFCLCFMLEHGVKLRECEVKVAAGTEVQKYSVCLFVFGQHEYIHSSQNKYE